MSFNRSPLSIKQFATSLLLFVAPYAAATDISTTPLSTYTKTSATDIKPNVMFVLDDSGSMNWDFMPDWACAPQSKPEPTCKSPGQNPSSPRYEYMFRNAAYNGVFYNPKIKYVPPVAIDSNGVSNKTTYLSQTGVSATTGGNSSATSSSPNWDEVQDDSYRVQNIVVDKNGNPITPITTTKSNLTSTTTNPQLFYTTVAGEYCDSSSLRTCITATAPSTTTAYKFPAPVRWCDKNGAACQAAFSTTNSYVRAPAPRTTTITINSVANGATISDISVGTDIILPATITSATTSPSTFAEQIAAGINGCNGSKVGKCTVAGYAATVSANVITITAGPVATASLTTSLGIPSISNTGTVTWATLTAFSTTSVPGYTILTVIVPGTTALYPFPGDTSSKPAKYTSPEDATKTRDDCAGSLCTGNEEMTNYANWWTYYRTRMQMMKTASGIAFSGLDTEKDRAVPQSQYRVGFMSINNNTNEDFVNLGEFSGTQMGTWFSKLIKATPGSSTPLRTALSTVGRLYGGMLNGATLNGSKVSDPLQYSCQRNYTILSTDGFWNEKDPGGHKLDGTTGVGNQDAGLTAPYGDGGSAELQQRTSTLQHATATPLNQYRNSQLQSRTTTSVPAPSIQQSTNNGVTWTDVTKCAKNTKCQVPISTSTDGGVTWTAWSYASSCTPDSKGSTRTQCSGSVTTMGSWTDVNSCTVGSVGNTSTECRYNQISTNFQDTPGNALCKQVLQSMAPVYTVALAVECQQVPGTNSPFADVAQGDICSVSATSLCQYTVWSSWAGPVSSCVPAPQSAGPATFTQLTATECQTVPVGTAGTSNTLADVAAYYYKTDLRTDKPANSADTTGPCTSSAGDDLCADTVSTSTSDPAKTQHMTTYTLGLGSQGRMIYAPDNKANDYWQDTSGDFYAVYKRVTPDTAKGICSWQTSGPCYWPVPVSNSNTTIDDLWHAAVNGHGTYFSASDANSLAGSLTGALSDIQRKARDGTAAAAASSNPNVTTTDNFVFSSSYTSYKWIGELIRQEITASGTLRDKNWSAKVLLDCATTTWAASNSYKAGSGFRNGTTCYLVKTDYVSGSGFDTPSPGVDSLNTSIVNADENPNGVNATKVPVVAKTDRKIFTNSSTALIPFLWADLANASLSSYFEQSYLKPTIGNPLLSQFCTSGSTCLNATDIGKASGQNLVNYLRGVRTNEGLYYRSRESVLGDIVSSEAKYVKAPLPNYTDTGFSKFKADLSTRAGTVYVGANDGMLHAFDGITGQENWAYIPSKIVPNLYQLADNNYKTQHQYFVDASPEVGDVFGPCRPGICSGNEWRTILISGLNRGGTSYFALDITDPANPLFLWEITDASMGYSYGNPKITKLKNGTWVVLLTSGYNNSDRKGYLYVRNALDGKSIATIATQSVGELAHINARALSPDTDNTAIAAYGGDTQGNLWRFDINGDIGASGYDAQKLISLKDAADNVQPITAKPEVATVNGVTMVYVGTGIYLGVNDIGNKDYQSFYGVIDRSDTTTLPSPRDTTNGKFVKQVLTDTKCPVGSTYCSVDQVVRTSTSENVDWKTNNGWYIDFLGAGERAVTDPSLALGTLLFTTILPGVSPTCGDGKGNAGSFLYALDYKTGGAVIGSKDVVGVSLGSIIATRPVPIELSDGTIVTITRGTPPEGQNVETTINKPTINSNSGVGVRRVSWRELTTQ
jgi:type IV pilus assembly protein PilY1